MTKKPREIEAIYSAALKKNSGEERSAYLDKVCGDDNVLRARVETLLKAREKVGDYLESPAVGSNATIDNSPIKSFTLSSETSSAASA